MQPCTGATTYTLSYDAENRLVEVKKNNVTLMNLVYDGDGQRVKSTLAGTPNSTVIRFVGGLYEYETVGSTTSTRQYYYAGSLRVAMREGAGTGNTGLKYLLGDHLGSTSLTKDATTGTTITQLYHAWGTVRWSSGTLPTKYTYTGQYSNVSEFGWMYYNARWYDPGLSRFGQADTIVSIVGYPIAWDRYASMFNNPLGYLDPSGHTPICSAESYADPECFREDNWIPSVSIEEILLAITIFSETSNGNYPGIAMESIGWVFENRVASGRYPTLPEAVGYSQSALTSALKDDFPWLENLTTLSEDELRLLLYQLNLSMERGANANGWSAAKVAASNVIKASQEFGYGSTADPTHGATDFKAKSNEEWAEIEPLYDWRYDHPKIWPTYFYVRQGPFWVDDPLFALVILVFDNRSLVTLLNPNLLNPE